MKAKSIKDALLLPGNLLTSLGLQNGKILSNYFIFCFHRFHTTVPKPLSVHAEVFEAQLDLLQKTGEIVSPESFRKAVEAGQRADGPKFLITFDDGYESVLRHAYPVLRERGLKAFSFIASEFVGQKSRFAIDRNDPLPENIISVSDMRGTRDVFDYQSHGHAHLDYNRASREQVLKDLRANQEWFANHLGVTVDCLAYPFGLAPRWKDAHADLRKLGFKFAFKVGNRSWNFFHNSYSIGRIGYLTDETIEHTQARLTGKLEVLDYLDHPFMRRLRHLGTRGAD